MGISHDGKEFSMSENAQLNFTILKIKQINGEITFPRNLIAKDDSIYSCDEQNLLDIIEKMEEYKDSCLMDGGALKVQINACTTIEELDAIEDLR